MSTVKERIFGAVTVMSDKDAEKVWNLIQTTFILANAEEVDPDEFDLAMLDEIESNPDCHAFMSKDSAMKELGL